MTWIAVWDAGDLRERAQVEPATALPALTLWLEIVGPADPRAGRGGPGTWTGTGLGRGPRRPPLRLWQGGADGGEGIGIYLMPDGALRLVHGEIDLATAPGTLQPGETVALRYVACAAGCDDMLEVVNHDSGAVQHLRPGIARRARLLEALPRVAGYLSVAHVVAIAAGAVPGEDAPGVASGTLIETPEGPRPVEALRPGDPVLDHEGTAREIRAVEARARLCLGRGAPVRLEAPFFGLARPLLVTPPTRLLQRGAAVEYLCGTDAVLARAADLLGGAAARRDRDRAVETFHHLDLRMPACILAERCPIDLSREAPGARARGPEGADTAGRVLEVLDRAGARALVDVRMRVA